MEDGRPCSKSYGIPQRRLRTRVVTAIIVVCVAWAKSSRASGATIGNGDWRDDKIDTLSSSPLNCTPAAVEDFPPDLFTKSAREHGAIVFHVLVATYLILALGTICDEYFVPVLETICDKLNLETDVAGATFMAAGTSSPEFFTNVMGTFVTESDLGIGTIVGSAVFNIFGVIAVCGLFSGKKTHVDWYPITRDSLVYGLTVCLLIAVLNDEQVYWYESLAMLVLYAFYIVVMVFNVSLETFAHNIVERVRLRFFPNFSLDAYWEQRQPLISNDEMDNNEFGHMDDDWRYPWEKPRSATSVIAILWWLLFLPVHLVLFVSVPDVRLARWKKWYALAFLMCVVWIGVVAYVVTWMITVIGYTFSIPDSVMGLSFLAIGSSFPEVFSSLIVAKMGKGSMAISNSIGSNTFDILICLGLPWLFKAFFNAANDEAMAVFVNSKGLASTSATLLIGLLLLYVLLIISRFLLSRTLGALCLVIYAVFLLFSILNELNVFGPVNLPVCPSEY